MSPTSGPGDPRGDTETPKHGTMPLQPRRELAQQTDAEAQGRVLQKFAIKGFVSYNPPGPRPPLKFPQTLLISPRMQQPRLHSSPKAQLQQAAFMRHFVAENS